MAYDNPGNFQNGVFVTLGAGPYTNLGARAASGAPTIPGWCSGSTNSLGITPASGGTTINSFDCSGMSDGFSMLIHNESTTDPVIFPHLGAGANPFKNQNAGSVQIQPNGAAHATFKLGFMRFS